MSALQTNYVNYILFHLVATEETTGAAQIKETTAAPLGKSPNNMNQEKNKIALFK